MKKFFSLVLALAMALSMASFATDAAAVYGLAVARGAEIAVEEINPPAR